MKIEFRMNKIYVIPIKQKIEWAKRMITKIKKKKKSNEFNRTGLTILPGDSKIAD